ncbi:prepilin-type N-terminal cleavage/methylation domain-containing protein [Clostridium felsineum]|uniref:prepilin-type N-terminal cleavage/methylation domain-containing protein n=1 Tax=Clostridium felsineum TaxID=36839 RepID=UPI00098BE200|nr:prepilin-type N-terminal cleavage/methylation domain-containing protein [Clostridium felsineum]MCR3760083.1 prepilin-type N-terminal cleavage/methylation domain-containing protein [Clostridium felsineum]URZ01377.1 hypothetical protein CLAUR_013670 [Clostridium felsineum]
MKKRIKKEGFTLIELIIVIAILAILAAILIPSISQYKMRAEKSNIQASARTLGQAIDAYNAENTDNNSIDTYDDSAETLIQNDIKPSKVPSCLKGKTKEEIDDIASGKFTITKEDGINTTITISQN